MNLDHAYDNMGYIPDAQEYPPRWTDRAKSFRAVTLASGRAQLGLRYGSSERALYDLFLPTGTAAGLAVFVHGGYWRRFDRTFWSHLASGALARGWSVAIPSYDLCPEARISEITWQIAAMLECVGATTSGPIVLTGHSAGGHLVARLLEPGLVSVDIAKRLHRVTPISPVADLRPLLQTTMNEDFRLTEEEAIAESPSLIADRLLVATHVWVGSDERPAFLDQARWLSEAWRCPMRVAPGRHHLDVIDALEDPESALVDDMLG